MAQAGNEPYADKTPTPIPPANAPPNAMRSRTALGTVLYFRTAAMIKHTAHTANAIPYNHFAPVLFMSFHCKKHKNQGLPAGPFGCFSWMKLMSNVAAAVFGVIFLLALLAVLIYKGVCQLRGKNYVNNSILAGLCEYGLIPLLAFTSGGLFMLSAF